MNDNDTKVGFSTKVASYWKKGQKTRYFKGKYLFWPSVIVLIVLVALDISSPFIDNETFFGVVVLIAVGCLLSNFVMCLITAFHELRYVIPICGFIIWMFFRIYTSLWLGDAAYIGTYHETLDQLADMTSEQRQESGVLQELNLEHVKRLENMVIYYQGEVLDNTGGYIAIEKGTPPSIDSTIDGSELGQFRKVWGKWYRYSIKATR